MLSKHCTDFPVYILYCHILVLIYCHVVRHCTDFPVYILYCHILFPIYRHVVQHCTDFPVYILYCHILFPVYRHVVQHCTDFPVHILYCHILFTIYRHAVQHDIIPAIAHHCKVRSLPPMKLTQVMLCVCQLPASTDSDVSGGCRECHAVLDQ